MEPIFIQLAFILITAFLISSVVRAFNQPIIIGYIFAGMFTAFVLETGVIDIGYSTELIDVFSQFGIAFLLFIVGLHLNPKVIKEVGLVSLSVGLGQILLTFAGSFAVTYFLLGFNAITSAYIGIAIAFSSTIIIMKILSDRKRLDSLYGKLSIGILIVQDIVAILVLMIISSIAKNNSLDHFVVKTLLGGGGLVVLLFFIGFFMLPRLTRSVAKSQELLFLFSICWCFVLAALFSYFGFSIEIGALIAGILLSMSPYSTEISAKVRPLRDFFIILFFIVLGVNLAVSDMASIVTNALALSLVVILLKPLIVMVLMAIAGYTKRTNFMVGTTLAQVSEFSLIVLALGVSVGHIASEVLETFTLTLAITIFISTYAIIYSREFYQKVSRAVSIFEKKGAKEKAKIQNNYDAILFGYNRIGFGILRALKGINKKYLVIDYNPDTIAGLTKMRIPCLYGDSDDPELLRELPLDKIEIAISTIPEFETNTLLIESIRMTNPKAIIIVRAHQIEEALELYQKGASYVLTPHFLGGEYVSNMITKEKVTGKGYEEEKNKHVKMLKEIQEKGFQHPEVERN